MNKIFCTLISIFLISLCVEADEKKNKFFNLGVNQFNKNEIDAAKLNFEKDIVRNTKNINSYLYLAKIYKKKDNQNEFEKNLKTVLLLDPKNEEALYLIIVKKFKDGDYEFAKNHLDIFKNSCVKLCNKNSELNALVNKSKS